MSIRFRIAGAFGCLVLFVAMVAGYAVYSFTISGVMAQVDETLTASRAPQIGPDPGRPGGPGAGPARRERTPPGISSALIDKDGNIAIISGEDSYLSFVPPTAEELAIVSKEVVEPVYQTLSLNGTYWRVLTIPEQRGAVRIAQDITYLENTASNMRLTVALIALLSAGVATGLGWWLAGLLTKSISLLTGAANKVAVEGEEALSLPPSVLLGNSEPAQLARAFTHMVESLNESTLEQKRLMADAAHELRTPLTSLRTNAQLLPKFESLSEEDKAGLVEDFLAEISELAALVEDALVLSSADKKLVFTETDLKELAEEAAATARRAGATVIISGAGRAEIDAALMRRAFSNLISNSVKFAPGSDIRVAILTKDEEVVVVFSDEGPGFPDGDLENVFQRFWRAPGAQLLPGSGLGLSIVESACERHGGTAAASNTGTGAKVTITLPTVQKQ